MALVEPTTPPNPSPATEKRSVIVVFLNGKPNEGAKEIITPHDVDPHYPRIRFASRPGPVAFSFDPLIETLRQEWHVEDPTTDPRWPEARSAYVNMEPIRELLKID